METKYIQLENVSKVIKKRQVLMDVSFDIKEHEVLGIQGINGSGKTMLLRAIAGLIRYEGNILFQGQSREVSEAAKDMGALIEMQGFLGNFTGKENLELLETLRDSGNENEIKNVLEEVGLDSLDQRKYSKYSLGMKQRLSIAQAILYSPKIILLDEPTNALDKDGISRLESIIKCRRKTSTFVIASHDQEFLNRTADRIIEMEAGRITDESK